MRFYSTVVFPLFHDWAVDRPHWRRHRREVLSQAEGAILEIGAGSGLNLRHYPQQVRHLVTVDPNPGMNRRLERRLQKLEMTAQRCVASAEQLPFADRTFDCVVSTLTLCSVPDVSAAVREVHRVLKPGGRFLFLEHGLSPDHRVRKWQRRFNRSWQLLGDGCRLVVDVREVVSQVPFGAITIRNFYMESAPKTHGYMYRGLAVR